jgi:hypothetical protein
MEETWMESTKRKDVATTTRESYGIKEGEMTKDEIIEMARQAGWSKEYLAIGDERLERFAKLVAEHERDKLIDAAMKAAEKGIDTAIALEREACAQMLEAASKTGKIISCTSAAEAIRARGQA